MPLDVFDFQHRHGHVRINRQFSDRFQSPANTVTVAQPFKPLPVTKPRYQPAHRALMSSPSAMVISTAAFRRLILNTAVRIYRPALRNILLCRSVQRGLFMQRSKAFFRQTGPPLASIS